MAVIARRTRRSPLGAAVASGEQMAGDSKCPSCGKTGGSKKRCDNCGNLACGKCHPQFECNLCRKGKMRDI
jgi:transcription elongation factor Elf1